MAYLRQNSQLVKGDELWLFLGTTEGQELPTCFANQHSLSRSLSTTSVSSKDHAQTSYVIPGEGSWTCSTEALMSMTTTDSNAKAFVDIMDAYDSGSLVYVKFGKLSNYTAAGIVDVDGAQEWALATPYWTGKGYITSLQASGGHGDSATFSIEITGVGPLTKTSVAPTPHTITLTGNATDNMDISAQSALPGTEVRVTFINPSNSYINMNTVQLSGISTTVQDGYYKFTMPNTNVSLTANIYKYSATLRGALASNYILAGDADTNGYYSIGSYVNVTSNEPSIHVTSSYNMTSEPTTTWSLSGSYFQGAMPDCMATDNSYLIITPVAL